MYEVPINVAYDLEGNRAPSMNVDWAALVKQLRAARGLTQEDFAHEIDVVVGTVNAWENDKRRPLKAQRKRLLKMAEEMGIQPPTAPSPTATDQGTDEGGRR